MKFLFILIVPLLCLRPAHAATTVEWGSLLDSVIVNSRGETLDQSSYTFQLGFFANPLTGAPFIPTFENTIDWSANWVVFDQATYNQDLGYFTSNPGILGNGSGTSTFADDVLGLNVFPDGFVGQQAYVWVYNNPTPSSTTEWFLATAPAWVFPQGTDDCCDKTFNVQWSISDLGPQTPVWGSQLGEIGDGEYEVTNPGWDLQTFTAVPEPSSVLLVGMGACGLLLRRKRESRNPKSCC